MITGDEPATGYGFANEQSHADYKGLTIRQQFSMAAMQGLCAGTLNINHEKIAIISVKCADALIIELNKEKK